MSNTRQRSCKELTVCMTKMMEEDHFSYSLIHRKYKYIYRALNSFCTQFHNGEYSAEAGEDFLKFLELRNPPLSKSHFNTYRNAIKRLNHVLLDEFHWQPMSKEKQEFKHSCFDDILKKYEEVLKTSGKTEPVIRSSLHVIARFLFLLQKSGANSVSEITPEIIYQGFQKEGSKKAYTQSMRAFLRYIYRKNLIDLDLSIVVPACPHRKHIPSVYTVDEINKILDSIDRSTSTGKRNYAIILITARLGLRSCDVANLRFSNINFENDTIKLIQLKTKESISFPMLPEIRVALIDYISNGRPSSDDPHIFLKFPHPYTDVMKPHLIYTLTSRIIEKSGVESKGRHRGPHALRSSLATQLLNEGNSYSAVQKILCHTSQEAIKNYVLVEIEKLRDCALEVSCIQSTGLAEFLEGGNQVK